MTSKEENILELFFNEGTKHWHFKEITKQAKISDDRANYWLKQFKKQEIITQVRPKGKMPYYLANFDSPNYKNKKKLFTLNKLYDSGLLNYLQKLKAKTIVLFGSFARADWYTESDIDLFILGDDKELKITKFESKLKREIQIHSFKNKKQIKDIRSGLMKNVINGYFIKGNVNSLLEAI